MTVSVGIDVVDVGEIEESIERFGDVYLRRVFTPPEIAACRKGRGAGRLAACFAAKEATLKAISIGDQALDWRSVEVRFGASGSVTVALSGTCAETAERAGIVRLSVSVSATERQAVAVAIAEQ